MNPIQNFQYNTGCQHKCFIWYSWYLCMRPIQNFQHNIGLLVPCFLWCSIFAPSPEKSGLAENTTKNQRILKWFSGWYAYTLVRMFMLAKQNMTHIDIELHFRKLDGDIFCFYGKRRSFFEPINDIWSTNISKWVLLS